MFLPMKGVAGSRMSARFEPADIFEIHPHGLDAESPGHKSPEQGRAHQDIKKDACSDFIQQDRK